VLITEPPIVVEQVRDPVFAAEEDAAQVHVLHLLEHLERRLEDRASSGGLMPALLKSTSILPNRSRASAYMPRPAPDQ
jgi:hypothetical protein